MKQEPARVNGTTGMTGTTHSNGCISDAEDVRMLLLIRHFERKLLGLYSTGNLSGTTHTCIGQELVPVSLRKFLRSRDYIFSNHRGHGHYLSHFDDCTGLLAEILGRSGSICNGVGGSQHIRRDRFMSSGVQGAGVLLAVGVAVHLKRSEPGAVAAAYIGDGTWGEGAVYEALNAASLWKLPLIIIVENNGIAQSTPTQVAMAGTIAHRCQGFDIHYLHVECSNVNAIRAAVSSHWSDVQDGAGPLVIEFNTVRLGPHSKGDDTRSAVQLEMLGQKDWYLALRESEGDSLASIEKEVTDYLDNVFNDVTARPHSLGSTQ